MKRLSLQDFFEKSQKRCLTNRDAIAIIQKLFGTANKIWGYSSAGRALEWHSRGQRFDPAYLHHKKHRLFIKKSVFF